MVDFKNLLIPCKDFIILSLVEKDYLSNDGYALRVPCAFNGTQYVDFKLNGGDVAAFGSKI